ncbi:Speract receptor [Eumeta japonica]|uniref:Guanylate cyclase n=1 Tax=Eumeta variegata TaxID=151549 RepID=A0A4C1ZTC1_EUMVA|nr:Speract receptor [Eumeta japonica]
MRDLQHDNVNGFVGACIEPPNVCALSEYCTRGSLKDILENDDIKLDNMFIASLVGDIIRGMVFIHESPALFHGALRPSNCLVDARWVVKLADFGLRAFRRGELPPKDSNALRAHLENLVYLSPELVRTGAWRGDGSYQEAGSPAADIYAFGLVLYELHTRRGPFGPDAPPPLALLRKLADVQPPPFRPPMEPLSGSFDCVRECCTECWAEEPALRPDFKAIRARLRPLRKGMKPNIFDNMIAMMEKYANNLEVLVDERTDQLQEEKKKTEALLEEMLPAPVAEQLKRGRRVLPESYDSVTIYFSDIVGFTAMSAESTPLQVVDFLNDLYTCFDSILENYDVYKVETIGDAYMVVSGLPIRNGIAHAGEVASMALALLAATRVFRVRHRPDQRLLLRVGIHSGPVCAGVVGLKMPRYCLFGDTVNTASRFESTGAPLKIHCSAACKALLDELGGYILEERGIVSMKGKRDQLTYWLRGEQPAAAAARARSRSEQRNTGQPPPPPPKETRGQRSSLKTKNWKNQLGGLHRCCSLESPKKLRFASGNLLESHTDSVLHHRSDEYLMEVIGDGRSACGSHQRGNLLEAPTLRHEHTSISCPIIEHTSGECEKRDPPSASSWADMEKSPTTPPAAPCDIKLTINGCTYVETADVDTPLLADTS